MWLKLYVLHFNIESILITCFLFPSQYLGCVEVFESRGMQVCEEALKVLRVSYFLFWQQLVGGNKNWYLYSMSTVNPELRDHQGQDQ